MEDNQTKLVFNSVYAGLLTRLTKARIAQLELAINEYLKCYDDGNGGGQRQFWLEDALERNTVKDLMKKFHKPELFSQTNYSSFIADLMKRALELENTIEQYLEAEYGESPTTEAVMLKESLDLRTYHNQPKIW